MPFNVERKKDGNIEISITVPWNKVKKIYDGFVDTEIKNVEIKGFRKGKAPRKLAEEKLNSEKIWQRVMAKVIPEYYARAIRQEQIEPILTPQVQLLKAALDNDLVFKATTAEAPRIDLGDYKKALASIKGKKESKIWVPEGAGKIRTQDDIRKKRKGKKLTLDDVLNELLRTVKIAIPAILVERQTNLELTKLLDQVQQVGMTIQQYSQSKGKTVEQIRKETETEAIKTLKIEFILEKIADTEKITVDDKEIEEFISKTKDKKEQAGLKKQRYFVARLLRRQKTLQSLLNSTKLW